MISVLLVEDEPEVLELTRLFLERDTELSVDACLSVKEALHKLNTKIYNVIVSDYYMPEINGIQLLKTLKFQGIDTPLIMFTGKGDEAVAIDALNFGAAFYLQKSENPRFQFAKLRKMIYEAALKQRTEEIYRENNICVIIPVHNNEKRIGPILETIPDYIFRIYVIDDASTDQTPEIIRKCAEKDTRITPIRHEIHKGTGSSVKTGYREALRESMDIAVVMSGDNQTDPKYLPAFLDPIIKRKADYAVGNRLQAPQYIKDFPRWRFFGNAILTLLTKIASGYWQLMDPQNRYTAISRTALERIDPNTLYSRAGYSSDILVRLNTRGFKAVNVNHPATLPCRSETGFQVPALLFQAPRPAPQRFPLADEGKVPYPELSSAGLLLLSRDIMHPFKPVSGYLRTLGQDSRHGTIIYPGYPYPDSPVHRFDVYTLCNAL